MSSQIYIKESFFLYKMCHNFKSIKAMKGNFSYIPLLKICAKFLGKVTREREKKNTYL